MQRRFYDGDKAYIKNLVQCSLEDPLPDHFVRFFFNDSPTPEIYTSSHTLSLHDALPIYRATRRCYRSGVWTLRGTQTRRLDRSEEHTSELQSRELISYAVFCLKKKK